MPRLTRWYLKTAMLYLALGAGLGALILWNKGLPLPGAWQMLAPHTAFVTWGWMLLLTIGMACWILPRWGSARRRVWLAAAAYVCLNLSALAMALTPWVSAWWLTPVSGGLQAAGCLMFYLHAWPRVRKSAYGV